MVGLQSIDAKRVVNLFAVFIYTFYYMHLLLFFKYQVSQSTNMSRCPVNLINLAATIVVFRPSEYDNKLRCDFQITTPYTSLKFRQKANTVNIVVNLCKTYLHISVHIQ